MSPNLVDPPATPHAADGASPVLAAVIDAAMDAIVVLDEAQRIIRFNPAAERMFGCPASEALGQPLDRFLRDTCAPAIGGMWPRSQQPGTRPGRWATCSP